MRRRRYGTINQALLPLLFKTVLIVTLFSKNLYSISLTAQDDTPLFSIVIPTYNRLPLLQRTLESVFRIDYPNIEIIVVNDGSPDGTDQYLQTLAAQNKIVYLKQSNKGPAVGRNLGIMEANGELIAFLDDDCIPPADWLRRYGKIFREEKVAGCGGSSRTGSPATPYAEVNDEIVNFLKNALNKVPSIMTPFLTSNNAAYRTSALKKVGGFDEHFTLGAEERDLNFRLTQSGEKLMYDPTIVIDHYNDADFFGFIRHQFRQGKGSYLFYRSAMERYGKKPPMIPPGVYWRLITSPFNIHPFIGAMLHTLLIVVAQGAITAGYFFAFFKFRPTEPHRSEEST